MRLLLDSHAIAWAATGDPRLGERARSALASRDNELLVSAASAWEIATKVRLGRSPSADALVAGFCSVVASLGARELAGFVRHRPSGGGVGTRPPGPVGRG